MSTPEALTLLAPVIDELVQQRAEHRARGEFEAADRIRKAIGCVRVRSGPMEYGVKLMDSGEGTWLWTVLQGP